MLYRDKISDKEFVRLAAERGVCVSIFLPTTRLTQDAQADRIKLKNLTREAMLQAEAIADKRVLRAMEEELQGLPEEELRKAVAPIVGELRQARTQRWVDLFHQRDGESRAITDLSTIAKLATQGQVSDLLVDADAVQYGTITEQGDLTTTDQRSAATYDVIDEIMVRVIAAGGEVLAVRKEEDAPAELMPVAAVLRWA